MQVADPALSPVFDDLDDDEAFGEEEDDDDVDPGGASGENDDGIDAEALDGVCSSDDENMCLSVVPVPGKRPPPLSPGPPPATPPPGATVTKPSVPATAPRKWQAFEDTRLLMAFLRHEGRDWKAIAATVGNSRNHYQCRQRYQNVVEPALKQRRWLAEETRVVRDELAACEKQGRRVVWPSISALLPFRCAVDVERRYKRGGELDVEAATKTARLSKRARRAAPTAEGQKGPQQPSPLSRRLQGSSSSASSEERVIVMGPQDGANTSSSSAGLLPSQQRNGQRPHVVALLGARPAARAAGAPLVEQRPPAVLVDTGTWLWRVAAPSAAPSASTSSTSLSSASLASSSTRKTTVSSADTPSNWGQLLPADPDSPRTPTLPLPFPHAGGLGSAAALQRPAACVLYACALELRKRGRGLLALAEDICAPAPTAASASFLGGKQQQQQQQQQHGGLVAVADSSSASSPAY